MLFIYIPVGVVMVEKNVESDLGLKNEMSFAIGNLLQMEEHLAMIIADTGSEQFIAMLDEIRSIRARYMKYFAGKELVSQTWCLLKHTLSTAYRLTEVATKNIALGNKEKAIENLKDSQDLFALSFIITQIGEKK